MINNSGTESKYNITLELDGTTGVKGSSDGLECFAEVRIRAEVNDVGPANVVYVQGRIRNSTLWHEIITITGEYNDYFDVSTYDFVRYVVLVADGTGTLIAAGYLFASPGSGGSITNGINYDAITVAYPTATTETYTYKLMTVTQAVITLTYTNSDKTDLSSVARA